MNQTLLAMLATLCVALGVQAQVAEAAEPLAITNGVSDNYKASYNANPAQTELRTWLSMDSITVDGTTWRPATPAAISFTAQLAVTAADGRSGTVSTRAVAGSASLVTMRYDPDGRWGPLVTVGAPGAAVTLAMTLTSGGAVLATGAPDYRAASFGGSGSNIEANGPAGRWYVGGQALRTDWEPTGPTGTIVAAAPPAQAAPAPTVPAPRITRLQLPVRTTARTIPLRVTAVPGAASRRITHVRVRIGNARYGRWVAIAPKYSVRLPAVTATQLLRVQVRDNAGVVSAPAARKVRCLCD